jgi:hypothetical protein
MESLAMLVSNIEDYRGREYAKLKKRVLATHSRSHWEKLDSLLSFPKMGANERLLVVLSRLNSLKPATLEELYMAIFLRLLLDSYREHFAHFKLATVEELAAKADGLWEMRGGNAATVAAISRPASPRRQSAASKQDGSGRGGRNNNRGHGGIRGSGNGGRSGGQRRDRSATPGGALEQDGGYATADCGNLHDGAFKGTGLCFHHYSYGRQATRCKPPCLFNQGNRAAAGSN